MFSLVVVLTKMVVPGLKGNLAARGFERHPLPRAGWSFCGTYKKQLYHLSNNSLVNFVNRHKYANTIYRQSLIKIKVGKLTAHFCFKGEITLHEEFKVQQILGFLPENKSKQKTQNLAIHTTSSKQTCLNQYVVRLINRYLEDFSRDLTIGKYCCL